MSMYCRHIKENAALMASYLDPMLSYAAFDRDEVIQDFETFDLCGVIDEVCDLALHVANKRDVSFKIRSDRAEVLMVTSNRSYLRDAILEVTKNAIIYSKENGQVAFGLNREETEFRLTITDSGPSIPPSEVGAAFSPFNRLGKLVGADGLGLGLAIVARILDALEFRYEINDVTKGGMCFTIAIPVSSFS